MGLRMEYACLNCNKTFEIQSDTGVFKDSPVCPHCKCADSEKIKFLECQTFTKILVNNSKR